MNKAILLFLLLAASITAVADVEVEKDRMFGINPLMLMGDIYYGHYGILTNDGKNEINLPFFFVLNEGGAYSVGPKYRWYRRGNWQGPFWGAGVDLGTVSFAWDEYDGVIISPKAEVGYRWIWNNGFTLAPTMTLKLPMGNAREWVETGGDDGYGDWSSESTFTISGPKWSVGLGLAWMF
ncbi:MAG: hypothetical protein QF492_07215 [Candidatus Krumholzibacteria bacterium]|nr:hypothetical protein [Candidatus Krumholzibacteria bacterium]MDP7021242.1 hypothetical protein [Candidatus Krumholzibacteria bacterium]